MKRTEAEMAECQTVSANDEEDWKEDETDDEDFYTGADENHQNDSGEVEDSREDLDDWFRNCDEPDDDVDEDEDEGYAQSPLHF